MYSRIHGLLGDIEHCIIGLTDHYYHTRSIHMEYAIDSMFQVLRNTLKKLQDIYYQHVLQQKLTHVVQRDREMLHITSTILVSLALNMHRKQ